MPPIAYAPQVYNWTVIYVGGHVGGGFVGSSWSAPIAGGSDTFNNPGFLSGGQVAANAQFNRMVVGVEGDFSWMNLSNASTDSIGEKVNSDVHFQCDRTRRRGVRSPSGLRQGRPRAGAEQGHPGRSFSHTASDGFLRTGWTAGAAFEYALTDNWSAKVECDYIRFRAASAELHHPTGSVSPGASLNVQEVKAGVNLRFGGGR